MDDDPNNTRDSSAAWKYIEHLLATLPEGTAGLAVFNRDEGHVQFYSTLKVKNDPTLLSTLTWIQIQRKDGAIEAGPLSPQDQAKLIEDIMTKKGAAGITPPPSTGAEND